MKLWLILVLGAVVISAIFALALCKAAGRADREIEEMMRHKDWAKGGK